MRGGSRARAGRKFKYKNQMPTKAMRVPCDMVDDVLEFIDSKYKYSLPLFSSNVSAGNPAIADSNIDSVIDLNTYIVRNPTSTFLLRVTGDSMINANINDGDLLVVDRSIAPEHNKIVIASVDGDLTVKRYVLKNKLSYLVPENEKYNIVNIEEYTSVHILGVVTNVIHTF